MLVPILFLRSILTDRQPTTMTVIGYQRVLHALPDGRPDAAAPDNAFVRTTTQWFLVADSDDAAPDGKGIRHVHVPAFSARQTVRYDSRGRSSKALLARFERVTFDGVPLRRPIPTGSSSSEGLDVELPKGRRMLVFEIRSLVDEVETHADGERRLTRARRKSFWSVASQSGVPGRPFVPERRPMIQMESGPHVQVDPPLFGYGPVALPKDDLDADRPPSR